MASAIGRVSLSGATPLELPLQQWFYCRWLARSRPRAGRRAWHVTNVDELNVRQRRRRSNRNERSVKPEKRSSIVSVRSTRLSLPRNKRASPSNKPTKQMQDDARRYSNRRKRKEGPETFRRSRLNC